MNVFIIVYRPEIDLVDIVFMAARDPSHLSGCSHVYLSIFREIFRMVECMTKSIKKEKKSHAHGIKSKLNMNVLR